MPAPAKMTFSDLIAAMRGALTGVLLTARVDTVPSPSHRPQVGKFGTYYAKGYQVHHADCLKQLSEQKPLEVLQGDLWAILDVSIAKPKTTIRVRPNGDVDNYAKGPMDAATKAGIWQDDGQVMALLVTKRWAAPGEIPGVTLQVGNI